MAIPRVSGFGGLGDMDMTIVMPCAIFLSALDKSMMAMIPEGSVLTS